MRNLRNKVQLIGNLGIDPEIKVLENKRKLCKFRVATSEVYTNSEGEKVQDTQWHNIIAWGKKAELAEKYLVKGKEVALEGKLTYRQYKDAEGTEKYFTEVVVDDFLLLNGFKPEKTKN